MARPKSKHENRLKEDNIVKETQPQQIDKGCLETQEGLTLVGYVGESPQLGFCRLYLTPELNEYYELRQEDVLDQICYGDALDFSVSEVRLREGAKAVHVKSEVLDLQTRFLVGELSQSFLNSAETQRLLSSLQVPEGYVDREKRQSNDEWLCTFFSGCTEGSAGGRNCTYRFGPNRTPGAKTKFHVTKDLKC